MKTTHFSVVAAALILLAAGCKKDQDDNDLAPSTPVHTMEATLGMDWMLMEGMNDFILDNTVLQDSLGHPVKLDALRFYVSGTQAMDMDGQAVASYPATYLLVDAASMENAVVLGTLHAPHLHELHFNLGLDAAANSGDPSTAEPPLDDPTMFFTGEWAGMGYKFVQLSGHADLDGSGEYATPVLFETGMDMALTPVHLHVHADLQDGDELMVPVHVDLTGLFAGLDLASANQPDMHSDEAMRLMLNLASAIGGH